MSKEPVSTKMIARFLARWIALETHAKIHHAIIQVLQGLTYIQTQLAIDFSINFPVGLQSSVEALPSLKHCSEENRETHLRWCGLLKIRTLDTEQQNDARKVLDIFHNHRNGALDADSLEKHFFEVAGHLYSLLCQRIQAIGGQASKASDKQ